MSEEVVTPEVIEVRAKVFAEKEEDLKGFNAQGMHPGIVNGRRVHPLVNTCEPYTSGKGKLGKHMKKLNDRRTAHSYTLKILPGNVNPTSYKTPGSMNQRAST